MATTDKRLESQETDQDHENGPFWSELLPDIQRLINERLFAGNHVSYHITCKTWQPNSIVTPQLLQTHDPPQPQFPYLMFRDRKTQFFEFYSPVCNALYKTDNIPDLLGAEIRFSKDDWFLMSPSMRKVFLFNPFTKERIDIPEMPCVEGISRMCFSSTPTSPDCVVFGISSEKYSIMDVCTYKLGEEDWKEFEYDKRPTFNLAGCSPVVYKGKLYCLGKMGELGIFNFNPANDEQWTLRVKPNQRLQTSIRQYMVESEGDLISVFIGSDERKFDVFKLDCENERFSWKDVESLGNKMLFVSRHSSFSGKSVVKGAGNKIYLPRFYGHDGVFYSFTTKKLHSIGASFAERDDRGMREMKQAAWVKVAPH